MKRLLLGVTLVVAGVGTVGVGAIDDIQMRSVSTFGSVTLDILASCPGADPAGAAGLIYLDTGSGNVENGLRDTGIPNTIHSGVNVAGGCSDGADADTFLECQTVGPMTRFLQAGTTCAFPEQPTTGPKSVRSAALAEGIAFALDGIVVVGAPIHATACNDDAAVPGADLEDCDATTGAAAGLAYARTITVADENTTPGIQCAKCSGPGGNQYTLGQGDPSRGWRDVLRIIYTGATMDVFSSNTTIADRDCDGDLRHTLVNHWGDMFQNDCGGGSCTQLRHAFRRDDGSNVNDTFFALIGSPSSIVNSGISPFCNAPQTGDDWGGTEGAVAHSLDTESSACCVAGPTCAAPINCAATGLTCLPSGYCGSTNEFPGGGLPARPAFGSHVAGYANPLWTVDLLDNDPIRRTCVGTYDTTTTGTEPALGPAEQVCRARRAKLAGTNNFAPAGTLGLVLPISPPETLTPAQAYPTKPCKFGSFSPLGPAPTTTVAPADPEYPAATRALTKVDRCPNGDVPQFLTPASGKCLVPLAADGDPACINGRNNLPTLTVDSSQLAGGLNPVDTTDRIDPVKTTFNGGCSGLWCGDGRVYNLHVYFLDPLDGKIKYRTLRHNSVDVPIQSAFYRIHTTRTLRDGVAAGCQEVDGTAQIGCLVQASPCSIGTAGVSALSPLSIGTAVGFKLNGLEPTKACMRRLIAGGPAYPLTRQLYLNTMAGFENVVGQELELAKCFSGGVTGGLSALEAIVTQRDFVTRGDVGDPKRSPACVDYPQQLATSTPPGCNQPLVTTISCASQADCPLGYACNAGGVCEAVNDACTNNPPGIPNDDPAVP